MEKTINMTTSDLYSVAEVAEIFKKPRMAIYRWIKSGRIISVRFGGISYIPRTEVDRMQADASVKQ